MHHVTHQNTEERLNNICLTIAASQEKTEMMMQQLIQSQRITDKQIMLLNDSQANASRAFEVSLCSAFKNYLMESSYEDVFDVNIPGGNIWKSKGQRLVQWDGIVAAKKSDDEYYTIFFIECKNIPHDNDILRTDSIKSDKLNLDEKIRRTQLYLQEIADLSELQIKRENNGEKRQQIRTFLNCMPAVVVFVYAAASLVPDSIEVLCSTVANVNVQEYYASCHHFALETLQLCRPEMRWVSDLMQRMAIQAQRSIDSMNEIMC